MNVPDLGRIEVEAQSMIPAPIIAAGASILGGLIQSDSSAKEARRNRDFQLMMSNTAHQREVKDLRAAGLNPILSGTGGAGATTAAGAMAQQQPNIIEGGVQSAMAANRNVSEVDLMDEQAKTQGSQRTVNEALTKQANALAAKAAQETASERHQTGILQAEEKLRKQYADVNVGDFGEWMTKIERVLHNIPFLRGIMGHSAGGFSRK